MSNICPICHPDIGNLEPRCQFAKSLYSTTEKDTEGDSNSIRSTLIKQNTSPKAFSVTAKHFYYIAVSLPLCATPDGRLFSVFKCHRHISEQSSIRGVNSSQNIDAMVTATKKKIDSEGRRVQERWELLQCFPYHENRVGSVPLKCSLSRQITTEVMSGCFIKLNSCIFRVNVYVKALTGYPAHARQTRFLATCQVLPP